MYVTMYVCIHICIYLSERSTASIRASSLAVTVVK